MSKYDDMTIEEVIDCAEELAKSGGDEHAAYHAKVVELLEELRQYRISAISPAEACAYGDYMDNHGPYSTGDEVVIEELEQSILKYRQFLYITGKVRGNAQLMELLRSVSSLNFWVNDLQRKREDKAVGPIELSSAECNMEEAFEDVKLAMAVYMNGAETPPDSPKWGLWAERLGFDKGEQSEQT